MKIRINSDTLLTCILAVYWCKTPITSAMAAVISRSAADLLVNLVLIILLLYYGVRTHLPITGKIFIVYFLIGALMVTTILIHPEYISWYTHKQYGITEQFLDMGSGIWAFLIIALYKDDERLLRDLKIVTALVFLAYITKFVGAMARGYWIVGSSRRHASYDMEFGFRILFATGFWGVYGMLKNKRYLILYVIGLLVILLGGSRAAFIWGLAALLAVLPYKYKDMSTRQKRALIIAAIVFIPLVILIVMNLERIIMALAGVLRRLGFSSRTLVSMARGTMSEDNGRSIIYSMAIQLIKTGGPFGRGFYGDRLYIGRRFYWGYSHNVFLELMVTFGYVGGTILSIALVYGIYRLYKKATDTTRRVIFLTFLVMSFKLILSNSFWYEPTFWGMLALMRFWKRKPAETEGEPIGLPAQGPGQIMGPDGV